MAFLALLDLLCLLGNLLLILTIYRCVELRTVSNFLILNLASIGILLSLIVLPSWIVTTLTDLYVLGESFCQVSAMIMLLLFLEAILTLGGVAIDRYGNICHPFRYTVAISNWKAILFIGCTWTISVILSSLPLLGFGRYAFQISEVPLCTVDFGHQPYFSILTLVFGVFPSCIAIFISYYKIFTVARDQARKVRNMETSLSQNMSIHENEQVPGCSDKNGNGVARPPPNPPPRPRNKLWQIAARSVRNSVRQTRAFRTVFTIIGCFLSCWIPYIVLLIYAIVSKYKPSFGLEFTVTYLALMNYVANPVICVSMNKEFRKGVKRVFGLHRKQLLEEVVTAWMSTALSLAQRRRANTSRIAMATASVHPSGE